MEAIRRLERKTQKTLIEFPMVTLKISPYTNVTLTFGWITLFMVDMGEGLLHREDRK
jgi:hypothetical protein